MPKFRMTYFDYNKNKWHFITVQAPNKQQAYPKARARLMYVNVKAGSLYPVSRRHLK